MGKSWSISTQAISSMNYFFLRTISGKDNIDVINQELEGFIKTIAERYWTIDQSVRMRIIKEINEGDYFKDEPIDQIEQTIHETIVRITGDEYPGVAYHYANLVRMAREEQTKERERHA
jgi:hypothetical protein